MLYWRFETLFRRCFNVGHWRCTNVVQRWKFDFGFCFIFNVGSTLFQRWSTKLKQRWSDVKMLVGISLMYKYLLEFIKIRSKDQRKNMSCERPLNFDQRKRFSENYKPIRVWLWLVYRFIENDCRLRLFSEFIQTWKRYPTYLDKISVLTWKLLVVSSPQRTYSFQNISYLSLRL